MNCAPLSTDDFRGASAKRPGRSLRFSHGRRAFTLIEILMAAVAGALILGSIYTVFTRAVQMRNTATARTQEVRLRTRAVNVIRNDLQNALVSGGVMAASLYGTPQGQASQFRGHLRFTTTTARSADAELHGDIQEVEYYIIADAEAAERNAGVLMRVLHNNLLGAVEEVGTEERLLAGVEAMEVSFYDGANWTDTWEVTEEDNTVPKAVRVRILPHATATHHASVAPIEILTPWTTEPLATVTSDDSGTGASGDSTNPPQNTGGTGGSGTTPPSGTTPHHHECSVQSSSAT